MIQTMRNIVLDQLMVLDQLSMIINPRIISRKMTRMIPTHSLHMQPILQTRRINRASNHLGRDHLVLLSNHLLAHRQMDHPVLQLVLHLARLPAFRLTVIHPTVHPDRLALLDRPVHQVHQVHPDHPVRMYQDTIHPSMDNYQMDAPFKSSSQHSHIRNRVSITGRSLSSVRDSALLMIISPSLRKFVSSIVLRFAIILPS